MGYVLRTDALHKTLYFAGSVEGFMKPSMVLTEVLMNAWIFSDRNEADTLCAEEFGSAWSVSEVSFGVSGNLKMPKKPKHSFEDDASLVSEMQFGGFLMDTMGGRVADYARIRAMKNRGVYDVIADANARMWEAEKAWIMEFGTARQRREIAPVPAKETSQ